MKGVHTMANRKNYIKKNEKKIVNLFLLLVLFLLLSLLLPAIGTSTTSPAWWVSVVTFFASVKEHFTSFWMFYSFAAIVLFAYFGRKK